MDEKELLRNAASDNRLKEWLDKKQAQATDILAKANDPMSVYRAQGRMQLIQEMAAVMEAARNSR